MKRTLTVILTALSLSGCAALPGQPASDYDNFCNVSGTGYPGDIYRITDHRDFWLTPTGRYLSEQELSGNSGTLSSVAQQLQGIDPAKERAQAVQVRIFKAESERGEKGKCLPLRYDDPARARKFSTLTNGRRLQVVSEDNGQSGRQIYSNSSRAGFVYKLL